MTYFFINKGAVAHSHFEGGSGLILIGQVTCVGSELNITDCFFLRFTSQPSHEMDVGVQCQEGKSLLKYPKWFLSYHVM